MNWDERNSENYSFKNFFLIILAIVAIVAAIYYYLLYEKISKELLSEIIKKIKNYKVIELYHILEPFKWLKKVYGFFSHSFLLLGLKIGNIIKYYILEYSKENFGTVSFSYCSFSDEILQTLKPKNKIL